MLYRRAGAPDLNKAMTLEACAQGAGAALACVYSSSAELDAALIAARRAAGVYGPKRRRQRLVTVAGTVAVLTFIVLTVSIIA
jgi:hypothetical protein